MALALWASKTSVTPLNMLTKTKSIVRAGLSVFHILICRPSAIPRLPPSPRRLQHSPNILSQLRHRPLHLPRQHIPKVRKGILLPCQHLVASSHSLDEFSRVDVRVAPVLDVADEFWGNLGERFGGGDVVKFFEGGREGAEFGLEDVAGGPAHCVVRGDLDHDLVEILDDVFELAYKLLVSISGTGCDVW